MLIYAYFKYDNEINSKEDLHNMKKHSGFYKKKRSK